MKKILLAGCSLWLVANTVAQHAGKDRLPAAPGKSVTATPGQVNAAHTLLWEISGNGLQQPSYLFGTMHLLCADDIRLSSRLTGIIRESQQIYFELDLDNMVEMMGGLQYIKMKDNQTLSGLLSPEEYSKVKDYFKHHPGMIPFQIMETFKPYFISSLITEQKMPCVKKQGMEEIIMKEAKQYHKEIKGLETIAFQAGVFDSIPYNEQARELIKYIDSAGAGSTLDSELVAVYRQQDLDKIEQLTTRETGSAGLMLDRLLYNRNADWAQKMTPVMHAGSVLFAVGAAHLPGEKGVISLLRKSGYSVKPLDNLL